MKRLEAALGKDIPVAVFLVLSTVLAYSRLPGNAFINLDDPLQLLSNERVLSGLSWSGFLWSFGPESPCSPVTWLAYASIHAVFGLQPWAYHVASLMLHTAAALLLYLFLRTSTGAYLRSAFVASLFALHPINVESVAWVAELNNVLSGLFFMLTLCLYGWYARRPGPARYLLTLGGFGLGLLAKPVLMTLPFILLLVDLWPLRRVRAVEEDRGMSLARLLAEKVPFMLMSLASVMSTLLMVREHASFYSTDAVPILLRLSNALVSSMKYLGKLFLPVDLALLYPYPSTVPWWQAAGAGILLLLISLAAVKYVRRFPYVLTGWLWFLGGLVPFLGIIQAGQWPEMADRYAYLTFIGIFIVLSWGIYDLAMKTRLPRWVLPASGTALIPILVLLTWMQVGSWKDSVTLFRRVVTVNPDSPVVRNSLANGLLEQGQAEEAIFHYREALRIDPACTEALFNLGLACQREGRGQEALDFLLRAFRADPLQPDVHVALGEVLAGMGRTEDAKAHLQEALRLDPAGAEALTALGNILLREGRTEEAVNHYGEALKVRPGQPDILNNLGTALAHMGRTKTAVRYFEEALQARPDFSDARENLEKSRRGLLAWQDAMRRMQQELKERPRDPVLLTRLGDGHAGQGDFEEAVARYRDALSARPDHVPALSGLALALTRIRDYAGAMEAFQTMRRLRPEDPRIAYNIACLHARQNNVKESLAWLNEAVKGGFSDRRLLLADPDLAAVRKAGGFEEILRSLGGEARKNLPSKEQGISGKEE